MLSNNKKWRAIDGGMVCCVDTPEGNSLNEKLRLIGKALTESEDTSTIMPARHESVEGASLMRKLEVVRSMFDLPSCTIFTAYPLEDIVKADAPGHAQGGLYLCDLRLHYYQHLLKNSDELEATSADVCVWLHMANINMMWGGLFRARLEIYFLELELKGTRDGEDVRH